MHVPSARGVRIFQNIEWLSIYLEPKCPLFWLERAFFERVETQKHGTNRFQVGTCCFLATNMTWRNCFFGWECPIASRWHYHFWRLDFQSLASRTASFLCFLMFSRIDKVKSFQKTGRNVIFLQQAVGQHLLYLDASHGYLDLPKGWGWFAVRKMEIFRKGKGVEEGVHQTRMCFIISIEYSQHSLFDDCWISQLSSNHLDVFVHSTQNQVDQVASLSESSTPHKVMLLDKNTANQLISVLICLTKVAVLFSSLNLQFGARRIFRGWRMKCPSTMFQCYGMLWDTMTTIHPDLNSCFFFTNIPETTKSSTCLFFLEKPPKIRGDIQGTQPLVVWGPLSVGDLGAESIIGLLGIWMDWMFESAWRYGNTYIDVTFGS